MLTPVKIPLGMIRDRQTSSVIPTNVKEINMQTITTTKLANVQPTL